MCGAMGPYEFQLDIFMVNSTGFVYQPTEWLVALSRCKADSMWILYNSANEQVPLTTQHLTLVMERDDPYDVPSTDPLFPWQQGAEYRQAERAAAAAMNREWDGASRTKNKVGPPEVTTKLSQQFVTTYGEDVPAYKSTFTGPNAKTEVDKIYRRYAAEKLRRDKITLPFVIKAAIRKMPKPTDLELTGASAASSPSARPFVFDNKACPMLDCTFQTINPDPVGLASHYLSAHVHGKIRVSRLECPGRIHQNCGHRIDTGNSLVIAINDHCAVQANKISARDLALLTASPAAKRLHFAEVAKAQPEKIQALRQQWNEQRQPTGNRGQKQKRLQSDQENDISIAGPSFKKKR
ncbi:hypothetical protein OC835_007859 [Tilletia horrida]|nr:hypothetical protein OC835_007859 [Tilletia horrida]